VGFVSSRHEFRDGHLIVSLEKAQLP